MLHKRMENPEDKDWTDHMGCVLPAYTDKMINRATGMRPYKINEEI